MPSNNNIVTALAALLVSFGAMPLPAQTQASSPPVEVQQASGPRATSGESRYDMVGYADTGGDAIGTGTTIAHDSLVAGSFVEITALDTGRTIVAEVADRLPAAGRRIAVLSPAATTALGVTGGRAAVRIRLANPSPQEMMAVRQGGAVTRSEAPQVLLVGLRKRLGPVEITAPVMPKRRAVAAGASYRPPAPMSPSTIKPAATKQVAPEPVGAAAPRGPGFYVQIAALSDVARARALATQNGGRVVSAGGFHRVQMGPYADQKSAQRARDGAARRGYGDARIVKAN